MSQSVDRLKQLEEIEKVSETVLVIFYIFCKELDYHMLHLLISCFHPHVGYSKGNKKCRRNFRRTIERGSFRGPNQHNSHKVSEVFRGKHLPYGLNVALLSFCRSL